MLYENVPRNSYSRKASRWLQRTGTLLHGFRQRKMLAENVPRASHSRKTSCWLQRNDARLLLAISSVVAPSQVSGGVRCWKQRFILSENVLPDNTAETHPAR